MSRSQTFKFRLNQNERSTLTALAEHFDRSRGDTLRLLIRITAQDLKIDLDKVSQNNQRPQEVGYGQK